MPKSKTRFPMQIFAGALMTAALVVIFVSPVWGQDPNFAIRYNGGVEAEVFFGDNGALVAYVPGQLTETVTVNGTVACEAKYDATYAGARHFFGGIKDSWYLGAMYYSFTLTSTQACILSDPGSGVLPMVGYHWLWESGFNLDLGLRPGLLALGFSF